MSVKITLPNGFTDSLNIEKLKSCGVENPKDSSEDMPIMALWKIKDYFLNDCREREPRWDHYMVHVVSWAAKLGIKNTVSGILLENFIEKYNKYPLSKQIIKEYIKQCLNPKDKIGLTFEQLVEKIDRDNSENIAKVLDALVKAKTIIKDNDRYRIETKPDSFFLSQRMRVFLHPKNNLCTNKQGMTINEIIKIFDDHYNIKAEKTMIESCLKNLIRENIIKCENDRYIRVKFGFDHRYTS